MMEDTMADLPVITVTVKKGVHVCDPTKTKVRAGDTVAWVGDEVFHVLFLNETPFVEGKGPFGNGEKVTVKKGLRKGRRYTPLIQTSGKFLKKTKGDVIPI
jgi:plastocyanin